MSSLVQNRLEPPCANAPVSGCLGAWARGDWRPAALIPLPDAGSSPMPTELVIDLVKGIAVGIVIALPVGPVGVLCVRRTLFQGPVFGLLSGLGAATADTMFGVIAGFGLTFLRDGLLPYQDLLGAAGGAFLLGLGLPAL